MCLVPKVNPGSILTSPVYTCVRDSWPYTEYNLAHPLPSTMFSSTTNCSAPEANSKLLNPVKTTNYNYNPRTHAYTKYNTRWSQLLVSMCPLQQTISRIAIIHTKSHLEGWFLLHQIRCPTWTCRPVNPPLVLNQIIQLTQQCQLRLPPMLTHILPQAGISPCIFIVSIYYRPLQ